MFIKSVKQAFFSPTGTTKAIANAISREISSNIETVELTKPSARKNKLFVSNNELLIIAVPVYMGRVPALLNEWLNNITGNNAPTICIVVYGNRTYGNALLELKDILKSRGCKPIAGAAFIGEHSFSSYELPIAENRPDASDLKYAESFAHKVIKKLISISSIDLISDINLPGNYPYGGVTNLWNVDFIDVNSNCTMQGICADVCPVGAIDTKNTKLIDLEKCISCCACIKKCPQNARTIKNSQVKDAAIRLNKLHKVRKEVEIFT